MKKANVKTKKEINIFVILAIVAVLLIAAMIVISTAQKMSIQGMMNDYISHEYGTKANVKMGHTAGTDDYGQTFDMWVTEDNKYVYDVANDLIIDYDRLDNESAAAVENVNAYMAEAHAEGDLTAENISYYVYTDPKDVTKDYSALVIFTVGSPENTISTADEAAEIAWEIIQSVEGYEKMSGVQINVFDLENEYNVYIDPFGDEGVSLESVKANTTLATEKSYFHQIWLSGLTAAEDVTITEGEVEVVGGEEAE